MQKKVITWFYYPVRRDNWQQITVLSGPHLIVASKPVWVMNHENPATFILSCEVKFNLLFSLFRLSYSLAICTSHDIDIAREL